MIGGNIGREVAVRESKATGRKFYSFSVCANVKQGDTTKPYWYDCMWFNYSEAMASACIKPGYAITVIGDVTSDIEEVNGKQYLRRRVIVDSVSFSPSNKKDDETQTTQTRTTNSEQLPDDTTLPQATSSSAGNTQKFTATTNEPESELPF